MACNRCYETVEKRVGGAYRRYGRFVARHPWKVIIVVTAVNCLLGIGMVNFHELIDVLDIYTPMNSESIKNAEKLEGMFPDLSGSEFFRHYLLDWGRQAEIIVRPNGGDILDAGFLREAKKLYEFVLTIGTEDEDGKAVEFSQVCAQNSRECAVDGRFFFDEAFLAQVAAKNIPFPYFPHPTRGPIYYEQLVGGANVSSGMLQAANMLMLRFNLRTDSEYYVETVKKWQDSFTDSIEDYRSDSFDFAYSHRDSISLELAENIRRDLTLFTITFTLMIMYACVATFTARFDCVGQRCILGIGGVLAAGLAILAAFGIVSACGVDFISIVGVVPFLIIGIGVDDMFILMSGMTETNFDDDIETRLGDTMATSGISITVTSLTNLLAFAAGSSSVFLGVRNFCIYCAVAVVFCYINQASMFLACIAINEQRTDSNRHFATCRPVPTKEEAEADGKSTRYVICCTGRKPRDSRDTRSFFDQIPRWLIPKLVLPKFMKVIILVVFAGYLGVAIYGITKMEEGVNVKQLVADDSYYMKFKNWHDDNIPFIFSVSFVFEAPINYHDNGVQKQIDDLIQNAKNEPSVKGDFEINWLSAFRQYPGYDNSSETAFATSLRGFLNISVNKLFQNDVIFGDNNVITYSRIHVVSENIADSQDQGRFLSRMRDLAAASPLPVFEHSGMFAFFEQFNAILSQTLQTVGVATVAVFLVTCIFIPHPLMLLLITVTVAMITAGIFGFLYFLDRTLSSITMVLLIMSVGFSVDFSAHVCHGYMISSGRNRNERMRAGILRSGAPIFHGAVSSILGVVVLAFGQSFLSITFFRVMTIVLIFGITHALLLLPVILSLIGPLETETRSSAGVKKKSRAKANNPKQRDMNSNDDRRNGFSDISQRYPHSQYSRPVAYYRQGYGENGAPWWSNVKFWYYDFQPSFWHRNRDGTYSVY